MQDEEQSRPKEWGRLAWGLAEQARMRIDGLAARVAALETDKRQDERLLARAMDDLYKLTCKVEWFEPIILRADSKREPSADVQATSPVAPARPVLHWYPMSVPRPPAEPGGTTSFLIARRDRLCLKRWVTVATECSGEYSKGTWRTMHDDYWTPEFWTFIPPDPWADEDLGR